MPQAPQYLRDKFEDDYQASTFLTQRGYKLDRDWCWIMPANHEMDEDEADALDYLIAEWDYGCVKA